MKSTTLTTILLVALIPLFIGLASVADDQPMKEIRENETIPSLAVVEFKSNPVNVPVVPVEVLTHSPWEDIRSFLATDNVSEQVYRADYICVDFSIDLARHLDAAGWDSGCVCKTSIGSARDGHMIVWVVVNGETLFVEPQHDEIFYPDDWSSSIDSGEYKITQVSIQSAEMKRTNMHH